MLDATPGTPGCRCRLRVDEWHELGVGSGDVVKWVAAGFTTARKAAPWIRRRVSPETARAWTHTGLGVTDAGEWIEVGATPSERSRWLDLGVDFWTGARRALQVGVSAHELAAFCDRSGLPRQDAVRVAYAANGDLERAHQLSSILDRFENTTLYSDPLATIGHTSYSVDRLIELLDAGLDTHDIWHFDHIGIPESELDSWLSLGLHPWDAPRAKESGWHADELRKALDKLEQLASVPAPPRLYSLVRCPNAARMLENAESEHRHARARHDS